MHIVFIGRILIPDISIEETCLVTYAVYQQSTYDKTHPQRCSFISSLQKLQNNLSLDVKLNIIFLTPSPSFQDGLYYFTEKFFFRIGKKITSSEIIFYQAL